MAAALIALCVVPGLTVPSEVAWVRAEDPDRIVVESRRRIESVRLEGLTEWSSYFTVYRNDCRSALLLVRTNRTPLVLVVELEALEGARVERIRCRVNNPWPYSQSRE